MADRRWEGGKVNPVTERDRSTREISNMYIVLGIDK